MLLIIKIFVVVIPKEGLVGGAKPILLWVWHWLWYLLSECWSGVGVEAGTDWSRPSLISCDTAHRVFSCYTQLSPSHMKHTRSQLDSANVGTAYLWVTTAIIYCVLSTFFKCFQSSPILLDNSGDSENDLLLNKRKVSEWLWSHISILHALSKNVVHGKRMTTVVHCYFFNVRKLPAYYIVTPKKEYVGSR